jgi:hypothetical protein
MVLIPTYRLRVLAGHPQRAADNGASTLAEDAKLAVKAPSTA